MLKLFSNFTKACLYACVLVASISCNDSDEFFSKENDSVTTKANFFDFSTTQAVDLIVDYSDYKTYGPVLFNVYSVNPIVNEDTESEYVNENIEPIFTAYTNEKGMFDATITLPAYAKVLHIVTGDFTIGLKRSMVEVINKEAKVKIVREKPYNENAASRLTRAAGPGTSTNDLSKLFNLSYIINHSTGKNTNEQIYKEWVTPLGTWNSASGRPDYLLDKATATPGLMFSDEEFNGLYDTAKKALNAGTTCKDTYRESADLTLITDSEVSITALGSMTCWNSSLGYYYYTAEKKPTSTKDLNIIMLFPNTQDGQRDLSWNYQGNIGTVRGDAIQLMYYPNIDKGDLSGATKIFPKGVKIGFILKPNGWSMLGNDYCSIKSNGSKWNKKINIWASSTEGFSYCLNNGYKYPNTTGEARTAKFSYVSPSGNNYAIVSFEDACDDKDYDDLLFALNPANAFAELPTVSQGLATTHGVYAFEDMWPSRGDYDMNDVLVDCKHEMAFSGGNVKYETYSLTTYQNFVTLKTGLAFKLTTQVTPQKIELKRINPGSDKATTATTFVKDGNYYFLTDDITKQLGTTYILKLTYSNAQDVGKLASIEPFIYRDEENGKRWEVHLPYYAPSNKMNMSYFGTGDDRSNISSGAYYVREGNYPFAFYLANAKAEYFIENILLRANESKPIDNFFPEFIEWSVSEGAKNADWYLHPVGQ